MNTTYTWVFMYINEYNNTTPSINIICFPSILFQNPPLFQPCSKYITPHIIGMERSAFLTIPSILLFWALFPPNLLPYVHVGESNRISYLSLYFWLTSLSFILFISISEVNYILIWSFLITEYYSIVYMYASFLSSHLFLHV